MLRSVKQLLTLALWLATGAAALCQTTASLKTQQTTLTFEAGKDSPRLLRLQAPSHEPWSNLAPETLIASATIDGKNVPLQWHFDPARSTTTANRIAFVYESSSPKLRLTWEWRAPSTSGPIEHQIHIENLDTHEIWIPLEDSLRFNFNVSHRRRAQPDLHRQGRRQALRDRHPRRQPHPRLPLAGTLQHLRAGRRPPRDHPVVHGRAPRLPHRLVRRHRVQRPHPHDARAQRQHHCTKVLGLNPEPPTFRTRLAPGEHFETPTVFLGAFTGGPDGAGNSSAPGSAPCSAIPLTWSNPHYPLAREQQLGQRHGRRRRPSPAHDRRSHELGFEMFHIDAGWFRGVGDWYPDPKKFPHGLASIADDAHKQGLQFGIWVDWDAGRARHPARRTERPRSQGPRLAGRRCSRRLEAGGVQRPDHRPRRARRARLLPQTKSTASSPTTTSTCSSTTAISSPRAASAPTIPTPPLDAPAPQASPGRGFDFSTSPTPPT